MKKQIATLAFLFLFLGVNAQIGIKGGLTYETDGGVLKTLDNTYRNKGEGSLGYHVGLYKKIKLSGIYVLPEIWYTTYKTDFEGNTGTGVEIRYKRIDVPVSLGTKILGIGSIHAGPLFSYYFEDELDNISDIKQDDISLGLQAGAGIKIQNLEFMLRYDFPLSERVTEYVQDNGYTFKTESTPKLLHLSIGYNF